MNNNIIHGDNANGNFAVELPVESVPEQEIICVLDKSTSMQMTASEAVEGFNKFLIEQAKIGPAKLTVVWFDNGFYVGYEGPIADMPPLTEWPIGGTTALTDAIGKTFDYWMLKNDNLLKGSKVIMAIITDGQENDSQVYNTSQVKELMEKHRHFGWNVLFLAADQDAWEAGQKYGIAKNMSVAYDSACTARGFDAYSATVSNLRAG